MAKKTKKVESKKDGFGVPEAESVSFNRSAFVSNVSLEERITALEQRIDRIVSAIDKSKKVRGL